VTTSSTANGTVSGMVGAASIFTEGDSAMTVNEVSEAIAHPNRQRQRPRAASSSVLVVPGQEGPISET
jgi:hypothetical protein